MAGLLDNIFSTVNIESLLQKKVLEYLCYLREIAPQVHTTEERIKFLGYRVRLTQRLIDLDLTALRNLNKVLAKEHEVIALKKIKYHLT